MKSSSITPNSAKIIWIAIILLSFGGLVNWHKNNLPLETSILKLIDTKSSTPTVELASKTMGNFAGKSALIFIGHPNKNTSQEQSDILSQAIRTSPIVKEAISTIDFNAALEYFKFYHPYRQNILTNNQKKSIQNDNGFKVYQSALASLYGPMGATSAQLIDSDPFLLFSQSLIQLIPASSSIKISNNHLTTFDNGLYYTFIPVEFTSASLSIKQQDNFVNLINQTEASIKKSQPNTILLRQGFLFYAQSGAKRARSEISIIGGLSIIGVILLLLITFKSIKPILIALATIGVGCLAALSATVSIFGSIHLFTLIIGTSLIGISIDYSFHYIVDRSFYPQTPTMGTGSTDSRIARALFFGLITSLLAYGSFLFAPVAGLQQIAVFSGVGLLTSWFSVICWYPKINLNLKKPSKLVLVSTSAPLYLYNKLSSPLKFILISIMTIGGIFACININSDDNVKKLQDIPANLKIQEIKIRKLLGYGVDNQFLIVQAKSAEELLQKEENIRIKLDDLVLNKKLQNYIAVSSWVPSQKTQSSSKKSYQKLKENYLKKYTDDIGLDINQLKDGKNDFITPKKWLNSPISKKFRNLWLGKHKSSYTSIIALGGIVDLKYLQKLHDKKDVFLINPVNDISTVLGTYRKNMQWLLFIAYIIIFIILCFTHGYLLAWRIIAPPVLAVATTIFSLFLLGVSISLFHITALSLILGIGIDYALFFAEDNKDKTPTICAISLSAFTTLLSFGTMALSSTNAVKSFGLTVFIGIITVYFLSPLSETKVKK